ncbi:MAG: hypothetical protein K6L73_03045 [Cellvibrionaceae bacterium]
MAQPDSSAPCALDRKNSLSVQQLLRGYTSDKLNGYRDFKKNTETDVPLETAE